MKIKLFSFTLILLLAFSPLTSCRKAPAVETLSTTDSDGETEPSVILSPTEDFGQEYLDSFIFFGESTTYHLKSRGVLSGGTETTQVWGPDSGTVLLDRSIRTLKLRYPETDELLTLSEALQRKKPDYLLLCFGLNGAVQKLKQGKEAYQSCYRLLTDTVKAESPDTKIILQSCFPVAANMDMSRYSITLDELNAAIRTINEWTLSLAETEGFRYLNTAEILSDEAGRLRMEYQSGDGHHLTREAYQKILHYIRTHGYT